MEGYVVRYHPEGWRDAKLEPPEEDGKYYCAVIVRNGIRGCRIVMYRKPEWYVPFGVTVTHWQPLPTPPWEIMPKENKNE